MTKKNHESLKLYPGFSKNYNHGKKIVDKFRKLSKIAFSVECFTADFSHFLAQMSGFSRELQSSKKDCKQSQKIK